MAEQNVFNFINVIFEVVVWHPTTESYESKLKMKALLMQRTKIVLFFCNTEMYQAHCKSKIKRSDENKNQNDSQRKIEILKIVLRMWQTMSQNN